MPRPLAALLLALPAGLALGVVGQAIDRVHDGLTWAGALGVPWLVVAFAAGALARDRAAAALAGAAALVIGTGTWYALHILVDHNLRFNALVAIAWTPAAAISGAGFALAGAAWRRHRGEGLYAAAAAATLAGALIGEAVLLQREWAGRAAQLILVAELFVGLALPLLMVRRRVVLPALALTLVAAVVLGVAEAEIRDAMRGAGWRGR
jgi:hypothetical protein